MKPFFKPLCILLLLLSAGSLQAQDIKFAGSHPPNPEVLQLIADYQRFAQGWKTVAERDSLRKKYVVAKGYFYHGIDGSAIDFEGLTKRQTKNELQFTENTVYDIILHQYDNSALVTYKSYSKGMDKGKPFEGWGSGITTISREKEGWRVTSDIVGRAPKALANTAEALSQLSGYDREVFYSKGADAGRVAEIAGLTQRAAGYFQQLLKTSPTTPLYILKPADWAQHSAHPTYGMANYQNGKLVVASDDNDFFRSFLPPLDQLSPPVAAQVKMAYGRQDGSTSMQPFFDLLALHELGHAFHYAGKLNMQRKWMGELFANLMLHTYVAEKERERLPALETFPQMVVAAGKAAYKHTSLADFERLYNVVGDKNYGWYQSRLHMAARQIYDAAGPAALQKLWTALQKNQQNLSDDQFVQVLQKEVHPAVADVYRKWDNN